MGVNKIHPNKTIKTFSTGVNIGDIQEKDKGDLYRKSFACVQETSKTSLSNFNESFRFIKMFQILLFVSLFVSSSFLFSQNELDGYIDSFDYQARKEMKVSSEEIVQLLIDNKAVLVDIRFKEEQDAWGMDYALKIPLPTLTERISDLPKDKLIVTACPHKDRAIIAMVYLKSKGFEVAYLKDGLIGLAEYLRGDRAKEFIEKFNN